MTNFPKPWLSVILWMTVIFFMSTDAGSAAHTSRILEPLLHWLNPDISSEALMQIHFLVRKLGHLSEYAVLAILVWHALMQTGTARAPQSALRCAGLALVISAAYAATDEFHQSFVPSRGPSVGDVLIDSTGALIGLTLVLMIRSWRIRLARRS